MNKRQIDIDKLMDSLNQTNWLVDNKIKKLSNVKKIALLFI